MNRQRQFSTSLFLITILFISIRVGISQNPTLLPSNSLGTLIDSLAIFELIDSLINLEPEKDKSQLAVRAGYNSNIVATGRPFELGQFGVSGGAAFYHRSGLFIDATGYWSNQYDPSYFLTVASLGFMKTGLGKFSVLAEYSRYFYNLADQYSSVSYTNNFIATSIFEHKFLNLRLDYSLYTGEKIGHRFIPTVSLNFAKRNWHRIRKISISPTFSAMFGIEQTSYYNPLFKTPIGAIFRIRHGLPLYEKVNTNEFGIMNYALSAPLSVSFRNYGFLLNYTYNIPCKLPGEITNLSNGGYLSFSIVRYFEMGSK